MVSERAFLYATVAENVKCDITIVVLKRDREKLKKKKSNNNNIS